MRAMRVLARAIALALPIVVVAACSMDPPNGEECLPGDYTSILLADGGHGFLKCVPDGSAYALYDGPDPNALPDANLEDGGDAAAACTPVNGKIPFMCFGCTVNSDCVTDDCFSFPNKGGNLCTLACTPGNADTVCPMPLTAGCGNNGNCKPTS